jgi:hypothetical protein
MPDETFEAPDDALLRRYLLGDATAEETAGVERHLLTAAEGLERIEAAEADLLDAAARDELPAAERERVLARLASTRAGRARLAFSHDLAHLSDGLSDTQPSLVMPLVRPLPPPPRQRPRAVSPPRAAVAAVAAGLAAVAVAGWLALRTAEKPPATAAAPAAATVHPAVAAVVFELSLATERGGATQPTLQLAPGTKSVTLRIQLEEGESYRAYRAMVHDAGGRTVASARGLQPRGTAGGPRIVLEVAAAGLTPGRYEVAVEGERSGAAVEEVGFQEFAVAP